MRHPTPIQTACLFMISVSLVPSVACASGVDLPREPALSPDGSIITFTWAGDLWAVPRTGGVASRLTSHPADERRSAFHPNGSVVAFESNRDGARNIYTVELSGSEGGFFASQPVRVTESDRAQNLSAFSHDGTHLLLSGRLEPSIYRHARMYRAPVAGGPVERLTDAFGLDPTPGRDGAVVFVRGNALKNRPVYRGPAASDLYRMDGDGGFEQLTFDSASDFDGHELPDGSIVFASGRDGQNNVYRLRAGAVDTDRGELTQLTSFRAGTEATIGHGVRDLTVSADGSTAAFVVWDTLYTLDLTRPDSRPNVVTALASSDDDTADDLVIDVSKSASEHAWHPSGDAVALIARGEIWLRSTDEDQPTRRITNTPWRERDLAWSPDGSVLYFSADDEVSLGSIHEASVALTREHLAGVPGDREDEEQEPTESGDEPVPEELNADSSDDMDEGGTDETTTDEDNRHGKQWADALTFKIRPLVSGATWDRSPVPSPDGRSLLLTRGLGDLVHLDLASGEERTLFEGWNEPEAVWMPDSRHIVYARSDLDFNSDIWLLDVTSGSIDDAVNLTRHPDIDRSPRLSTDGKVLVFTSDRAGNNWDFDVHRVYLDESLDDMSTYERAEYFESAAKAASQREPLAIGHTAENSGENSGEREENPAPLTLDAESAWLRIERVTSLPGSEGNLALTPGGDRIIFSANVNDQTALRSVDYDGDDMKTVLGGSASHVRVSLDGATVTAVQSGQVKSSSPTGGDATDYPLNAEVRTSKRAEQRQKFLEGARTFGRSFYNLKGLDWNALTNRYLPLAESARTSAEFNAVFTLLLGEVNGSHTAILGGPAFSTDSPATGYLGIDSEPTPEGYRVTRVLEDGPSSMGERGLLPGDVIVEINSRPLNENGSLRDFTAAMTATQGHETLLTIERDGDTTHVLIQPVAYAAENNLRYNDEVAARRAAVERLGNGRLGYLHIRGMNLPSVRDFERDLYGAAHGRDGLVIDVRDNGGGFTTDILLASLTAPRHAYTIPRGADPADVQPDRYPRDRRLIYGYTRPINVLMNENSFSNAEIFSHSIKTSGRGRLIGKQTFGGVISTGGFSLIDGTFVRRPFRGWYLPDGTDMDAYGAEPDVPVEQTPADEVAGRDRQLEAAVRDLLEQIDSGADPRAIVEPDR